MLGNSASQNAGITTAPGENAILDLDQEDLRSAPVPTTAPVPTAAPIPVTPVPAAPVPTTAPVPTAASIPVTPVPAAPVPVPAPVPTATVVTQVAAGAPIPLANPIPSPSDLPYLDAQTSTWYAVTRGTDVGVYADW
jgi:hypothetical protein